VYLKVLSAGGSTWVYLNFEFKFQVEVS